MGTRIRGKYAYYRDVDSETTKKMGIDYKVIDQIKALKADDFDCELLLCKQPESLLGKVCSCLPLAPDGLKWPSSDAVNDISFLYIRRPRFISREMIGFLRNLKGANPSCLVLLELPCYPYDEEMKIPLLYPALKKDQHNRKKLPGLVDYIVAPNGSLDEQDVLNTVFGVPRIDLVNGIDVERVPVTKQVSNLDDINIAFAAYTLAGDQRYGIDRLLTGLAEYYRNGGKRNVYAHLAIGGSGAKEIEHMIRNLGLTDHAFFYGELNQEELKELTDKCSIGMAPLGLHRIGVDTTSALKTREYLAKGLPFFYSGQIDVFINNPVDFCLQCPANDDPIDIDRIIQFHDELYSSASQTDVINMIRDYAINTVSTEVVMRPIRELVESHAQRK